MMDCISQGHTSTGDRMERDYTGISRALPRDNVPSLKHQIIELYAAAPGAGTFTYTQQNIVSQGILCWANAWWNQGANTFLMVYKGAINAFNVANHRYAIFMEILIMAAGATYPTFNGYMSYNPEVPLEPGMYTFAIYNVTASTNQKALWVVRYY